ncbi:MAG: PhoH family protein [Thiotrichaceae bacterium]|nr:PhoH family protein [Thiotrichaceae bacterium]
MPKPSLHFEFAEADNERLLNLCGAYDQHLKQIETALNISINNRANIFNIKGTQQQAQVGLNLIQDLYKLTEKEQLSSETIDIFLRQLPDGNHQSLTKVKTQSAADYRIKTKRKLIRGRGANQNDYIRNIQRSDLAFGIGPAGTGKTYLAVASAVEALERDEVRRLLLVRPAVEAGERLGFLPGDLSQKIDPYLRPMYDALYEFMGVEKVARLIEKNVIEVAPLAYMRGRTLNDAFIIMDEAQNTTPEQMKMFLTRIGFGSTAVVTGDITQIDLPSHQKSGLKQIVPILEGVKDISFTHFINKDVVRHALVQRIIDAYDSVSE